MAIHTNLPLRTAIIGLSASAKTSWAADAHLPALTHPHGRQLYVITALCNSSVEAARRAVAAFNLPASTKTYGSPTDSAADSDIDVVICNTRVDKHYETVVDSIKAGKKVYIEWPVTSSVEQTEQLLKLERENGAQVAVGLQAPWAPPVVKLSEVIESGKLGRVLSSDVRGFGGTIDRKRMPIGLKYFGEKEVGGHPITISFGHMIDYVQSVLGSFVKGSTHAKTQIQRPKNQAFDPKTKEVVEEFESNVPDLISVVGTLPETQTLVKDATLSVLFRRGQQFKGEPALIWLVNCEYGEIRLVAPSGVSLQADAYTEPVVLNIHHFGSDSVETVEWDWSGEQKEVPIRARSVMKTLYAFAEGDESGWTNLESALLRAEQIDGWLEKGKW